MCVHYNPKAISNLFKDDPTAKDICELAEKQTECFDFLENSPNANPVYTIKEDVTNLMRFVMEASKQISKNLPAKAKTSFDTCTQNFNEVGKR